MVWCVVYMCYVYVVCGVPVGYLCEMWCVW